MSTMHDSRKSGKSAALISSSITSPSSEVEFDLDDPKQMFFLMAVFFGFIGEDRRYVDLAYKDFSNFILALCFAVTRSALGIIISTPLKYLHQRITYLVGYRLSLSLAVYVASIAFATCITAESVFALWLSVLELMFRYAILMTFVSIYLTLHDIADWILGNHHSTSSIELPPGFEPTPSSSESFGTTLTASELSANEIENLIPGTTLPAPNEPDLESGNRITRSGGVFGYFRPTPSRKKSPRISPSTLVKTSSVPVNQRNISDMERRAARILERQVSDTGHFVRKTRSGLTFGAYPGTGDHRF